MIIDIIVILKYYLSFNSIGNGGVRIRYPFQNIDETIRSKKYIIYN